MSSNNEYAIQVQDVSKIYKLYDKPIDRLKESLSLTHKNYHKDFFALSDISFNVKKGETVGIIGTNGSGKSTILKIITGVLTPTSGLSIEWLKLRSALTTILVPQPLTSNPQPKCKLCSNGMPVPLLRNGYSIFNGTKYR